MCVAVGPSRSVCFALLWPFAASQTQWFDVTKTRHPAQCERMACLSVRLDYCRDHLDGFYLREKGCSEGKICTNCKPGNSTVPAICKCENPPYTVSVTYGQACGLGRECTEGVCFRPCHTFLHSTLCPSDPEGHCVWHKSTGECRDRPPPVTPVVWMRAQEGQTRPVLIEAQDVLEMTAVSAYPISIESFKASAKGFRIYGVLLEELVDMMVLFSMLDKSHDGGLSAAEYANLPVALHEVEIEADHLKPLDDDNFEGRRLQSQQQITPETCNSKRPRQYFCSFDISCKTDCRECGWKSATDSAFSMCVRPTPESCNADADKVFCDSDQMCHPSGDCSNCVDRPIVDNSQHSCLQLWWGPEPLQQMRDWVCRARNKVGMSCQTDQDCIYGMRRCLYSTCQPFQPYNPNQTCISDLDCPHIGFFCPADPTGGENKFWVQYCREQGDVGRTCQGHRECKPDLRCNTAEQQPRCRRLFSLEVGAPAAMGELCLFGWRDKNFKCAPPAKSKRVGFPCDSDDDCETTDITGKSGSCVCKAWWESSDGMYCNPVAGDYHKHQEKLRNYLDFQARNCGTFYTEEECLRVFGTTAQIKKLELECETETLVGGPYIPDPKCGIVDDARFPSACDKLQAVLPPGTVLSTTRRRRGSSG